MLFESLQTLIFDKAIPSGARQVGDLLTTYEWDVQAHCDDPKGVTHHARRDDRYARNEKWQTSPGSLTLHISGLPCRACPKCLRIRARLWKQRARVECGMWPRTWFCTYTFKPEEHHAMLMRALAERNRAGWLDSDWSAELEYKIRCVEAGKIFTRYLKRVRKPQAGEMPVTLRYLLVAEQHESGLPHFHALVHECDGAVTYRRLMSRWPHGHATAKLVQHDGAAANYVAKYISKGLMARVRPSLHYGQPAMLLTSLRHRGA